MKNFVLLIMLLAGFAATANAQEVLTGLSPNSNSVLLNNYGGTVPEDAILAYGNDANNGRFVSFPIPASIPWTEITTGYTDMIAGADFDDNGNYYGCFFGNINSPQLVSVDVTTGAVTVIGPLAIDPSQSVTSFAYNTVTSTWYLGTTDPYTLATSMLYSVDISTGATTLIGTLTNCPGLIAMAIDCSGNAYGIDAASDNLVIINLSDASGTIVGPLGVDAAFAQDADFDPDDGTLYWAGYMLIPPFDEAGFFATIDVTTGASTEIINWGMFAEITGFAVDATCQVVPVELGSFSANVNGNEVVLNWTTVTETNNSGFEIEKESSTSDWETIGFVPGFGTSTEIHSYSFIDDKVTGGSYSYRLKQIDYDGSFEYSDVVNVVITTPVEFNLEQNYPNPFNPSTKIKFSIPNNEFVNLTVYNALGEKVAVLVSETLSAGQYTVNFDASGLASGVYIAKVTAGNYTDMIKMNLLK